MCLHEMQKERDDFTREPPCLLRSTFGRSVSAKPPLTFVFFQRRAFTPIPLNDASMGA